MYDVIIIGAGTAGLTSSIYATRGGLSTLIIENNVYGGQIVSSPQIDNYPSLANISGFDFVQNLYAQAIDLGAILVYENPISLDLKSDIKVVNTSKNSYKSKSIIIATGSVYRKLECENEDKFEGKGVSYCATCDGAFYRSKNVCVIGGGNSAVDEAIFLSNICKKVYLIHRREKFRADLISLNKAKKTPNIEILTNFITKSINGNEVVSSITIENIIDKSIKTIDVSGVFISIGRIPQTDIFKGIIDIDENGYIIASEECRTNIEGVYVAGDVRTKSVRQLVTATADGAVASTNSIEYIL